jgi:hypothetical protein
MSRPTVIRPDLPHVRGAYLDSTAAAEYCGYTAGRYRYPQLSFMQAARRHAIPVCRVGRRAFFMVRDLDEAMQRLRRSA